VIAHVELNQGVWYPQGGIYSIATAFARLAAELGVEFRYGQVVEHINLHNGSVCGVELAGGERLPASAVLANVDAANVAEKLLPPGSLPAWRLRRLLSAEPSCSGFILLLGVRGQHPQLAHHNIFFSRDYRAEFHEIFAAARPPTQPTVYVAITSKSTPTDAPPGCENWFVLVNAPALADGPGAWNWEAQADAYRRQVLELLAERGFDLSGKIEVSETWTPRDIACQSGARRGALYGASSNNRWAAFLRPHNRDPHVGGLYYAGGTVHPGGGVPMVTLSGQAAASLLLEDGF
jgi:phytoene desaturase